MPEYNNFIDLGKKSEPWEDSPVESDPKIYYPTLCINDTDKDLFDSLEVGEFIEAKVKIKVRSKSSRESEESEGKHIDLEVQEIAFEKRAIQDEDRGKAFRDAVKLVLANGQK